MLIIGDRLKVLLVDDEPFIRKGLAALVDWTAEGYIIAGEASGGASALELLSQDAYDLVITDIRMPDMDGLELITRARRNGVSQTKFVLLSGYYDFEYAKKAIQYGCCDYMLKPVKKTELLGVIRHIREELRCETINRKETEAYEKAYLDRRLLAVIWNKYDNVDLDYINSRLHLVDGMAYTHVEISLSDKRFLKLSKEKRTELIRILYDTAGSVLAPYTNYITSNLMKYTQCYNIGTIFIPRMAADKGGTRDKWLTWFTQTLTERIGYEIMACMGSNVASIEQIADSYKEAMMLRSLQMYRQADMDIHSEGESNTQNKMNDPFRKALDDLLHAIMINETYSIRKYAGDIYHQLTDKQLDDEAMNRDIQLMLHRLLGLAYEYEGDINQEEVLHYIRGSVFSADTAQDKSVRFEQFALEYAKYLAQLRQSTAKGVFQLIEAEIEENFAQNISLKSLGEKHFVNSAYLGQLFKRNYGCTFKDYLNQVRIRKAAAMLLSSDKRMYEIAEAVGYKSTEYFVDKFEEAYSMTPTRFRKRGMQTP